MNFHIEGNEGIISRLEDRVANGRLSHAYIFEAPAAFDKTGFAKSFIKGILCPDGRGENCGRCSSCIKVDHDGHEDIIYIDIPEDRQHIVADQIKELQLRLSVKPFGSRNIVVIRNADYMVDAAANKLLKTLEEPPGDTIIILLSENMEELLPTIRSRCVKFSLDMSLNNEVKGKDAEKAEKIAELSLRGGSFCDMCCIIGRSGTTSRDNAINILDRIQQIYRDMVVCGGTGVSLLKDEDGYKFIHAAETAKRRLQKGRSIDNCIRRFFLDICR